MSARPRRQASREARPRGFHPLCWAAGAFEPRKGQQRYFHDTRIPAQSSALPARGSAAPRERAAGRGPSQLEYGARLRAGPPARPPVGQQLSDQSTSAATERLYQSRGSRAVTPVGEADVCVHQFTDDAFSDLIHGW
jgi:hypothetical protein